MLYDRVMKKIQNRRINHTNSFINARLQRKLRKFAENPLSGSRVLSPRSTYEMGPGSRVPQQVPGFGSHFSDMPFSTEFNNGDFSHIYFVL